MKNILVFLSIVVFTAFGAVAQSGVAVNTTGSAADPSAMLDVSSSTKGFLMPRMSMQERIDIVNPVRGLLVYQIDGDFGFWFYDGIAWGKANAGDNLGNHAATDSLNMSNNKIVNVATCTQNLDAANKEYVDNAVAAGGGNALTMLSDESSTAMNFIQAMNYCRNLSESGYTDWFLPSFDELTFLISSVNNLTINNPSSTNYIWTRTESGAASYRILSITLSDGKLGLPYGYDTNFVRCIR